MGTRAVVLGLAASSGLFGCNGSFEKQSQIARVRVLGVRAEPAELTIPSAGPPRPVHLEALAVAPEGAPVSVRLAFCRPFANAYAPAFECPGADGVELVDGVLDLLDPRVQAAFGGGSDGGAGGLQDPTVQAQLEAGLPLQVGYLASDGTPGAAGVESGVATLTLRATDSPNRNPGLLDVQVDGVSLEGLRLDAGATVTLTPVVGVEAFERYQAGGDTRQESLSFSWFASGGAAVGSLRSALLPDGGGAPSSTLTTPLDGGVTTVWVVVRDTRGGTSWLMRTFSSR